MAEPVRLNPNQYLSNGLRKEPNQVYSQLIQSAWGAFSRQAGRQADGQACSVGLVLEGCPVPPGMVG